MPPTKRELLRRMARTALPTRGDPVKKLRGTLQKFIEQSADPTFDPWEEDLHLMLFDPCAYCGRVAKTWDHIEPLARGGTHARSNLARSCRRCNAQKDALPLAIFLAERAHRQSGNTERARAGRV